MHTRRVFLAFLVALLAACGGGGGDAPTEQDVRDLITRREEASATGTGSVHSGVALDFHEVRFGEPRSADERDRVVNGITGSTVYPVRVRYTSNRTWGNGQTEAVQIHYDYELYRDPMNEWNAYLVGPVR